MYSLILFTKFPHGLTNLQQSIEYWSQYYLNPD